jgi:hypothetical protein
MSLKKEDLRAKVCHVCGTTEDLVACPACHWWFCKEHDLHECTPEPQNPVHTDYTGSSGGARPSDLWYFVPFFFGIIGGLVAYVGVKDEDADMAKSLLLSGIVWFFFWVLIFWILWSSR